VDGSLRPAWANISQDTVSKIIRGKWARGVSQIVEGLLCKHKALSLNPSPNKKRKGRKELRRKEMCERCYV
jgi:hypothetical protein